MTTFTYTTTDIAKLAGITAARNAYNSTLPDVLDSKGVIITPNPNIIATDQDYMQMVMDSAVLSYAKQFSFTMSSTDIAAMQAKIANVKVITSV